MLINDYLKSGFQSILQRENMAANINYIQLVKHCYAF